MKQIYTRICPGCKNVIEHKTRQSRHYSKNKLCRSCIKLGHTPWNKGKSFSEDVKFRMSESAKKRANTDEGIRHLKNARRLRNNKLSESTKRKISRTHRLKYAKSTNHPNYNKNACILFDEINREMGWNGQHAENGGEFFIKELGYWVDYYEPTLNIVKESKDKIRQSEIESFLGCKFLRIKETQNLQEVIDVITGFKRQA